MKSDPATPRSLEEILARLQENHCPSPADLEVILAGRERAIPPLLAILERAAALECITDDIGDAPMHALFLLGALEAGAALEPALRLLRRAGISRDDFFGDILTECLPWTLARLACDDATALLDVARDPDCYEFARNCALRAYCARALLRPEHRAEMLRECERLIEDAGDDPQPSWPSHLALTLQDLVAPELRAPLEALYDRGLVDPMYTTKDDLEITYENCELGFATEEMDILELYDAFGWMIGWHDPEICAEREANDAAHADATLREEEDIETSEPRESEPSSPGLAHDLLSGIGRNDPCPCGSLRKYKKCCLNATDEQVIDRLLGPMGSGMTAADVRAEIAAAIRSPTLVQPSVVLSKVLVVDPLTGKAKGSKLQVALFLRRFLSLWNRIAAEVRPG